MEEDLQIKLNAVITVVNVGDWRVWDRLDFQSSGGRAPVKAPNGRWEAPRGVKVF